MAKSSKKDTPAEGEIPQATAAMMSLSPVAMQAWQDVITECNRFVMDRLQQDLETQQSMLSCKSPADLMKLQTEFFQTAFKQYSEESIRLMQMMSDAAGQSMKEVQSSAKRRYDDVPL